MARFPAGGAGWLRPRRVHPECEGLASARAGHFDLVLSDVLMPHMAGFELCRKIKSEFPSLPVMLVTTLDSAADIVRSDAYRAELTHPGRPPLASTFLCLALIHEAAGQLAHAGQSALEAAWVCDDEAEDDAARICRQRAIAYFKRARARGAMVTEQYGATLEPSANTPAEDRLTQHTYDVLGNQTSVTDAEGRTTTYVYNVRRQLVEVLTAVVTAASGSSVVRYETSYAYDGEGNRVAIVNNRGFTTELLYNEDGLVSRRTDPNGHVTQYNYDANNNQLVIIAGMQLAAAQRRVMRFAYDEEDQLIRESDALGEDTLYTHDAVERRERD